MSEQVEIEVSANLTRFNAGMANVRNSVLRASGVIQRLDFNNADQSLGRLKQSSRDTARQTNTLAGIIRRIAETKIDSRSIKDFKEIFKELLRIVVELGPIITLAMNAGDGAIRKFAKSNRQLLTEVERLSSNFLVLRKVLPIRFFTAFATNTQRVSTSIKGMSKDINDFTNFTKRGFGAVVSSFSALKNGALSAGTALKDIKNVLQESTTKSAVENNRALMQTFEDSSRKMKQMIEDIRAKDSALGKLGAGLQGTAGLTKGFATASLQATGGLAKMIAQATSAVARFSGLGVALRTLNPRLAIVKVTSVSLVTAFTALRGTVALLGRGLVSLGQAVARTGIRALSNVTQQAVRPVRALGSGIKNIVARPIQTATSAFTKMRGSLVGVVAGIAGIATAFVSFGRVVTNVANGSVAQFNINFRKAMAELPRQSDASFGKIKKDIMALQNELGFMGNDSLPALRQAFRKGFDADNAVGAVRQAMLLAKTGTTDLEGAVDILGNSMRAFSSEGLTASEVVDKLFRATRGVDVNFNAISESVKRLGPDIASSGVRFEDFLASLKTLSQQGRIGSTAISELRALFSALVSPAEDAQSAMNKLGLNFTKADLSGRGLSSVLDEVRKATGGSVQEMANILGGQENLNTALLLGARNGKRLADNLQEIQASTGSVAEQADQMDTAFSRAVKKMSARIETLKVELGQLLDPAIGRLGDFLSEWTSTFTRAVKVAVQLFRDGNLGDAIFLGISIGLSQARVAILNFATRTAQAISSAFSFGVQSFPQIISAVIPRILAQFSKLGFFFLELGGKLAKAFETPIAVISAGLKKVIEEAKEQINKLPFMGGDDAQKARTFKQILAVELENSGNLAKGIQSAVSRGYSRAEEIIRKTDKDTANFISGLGESLKDGFKEGADAFVIGDDVKADQRRLGDLFKNALKQVEDLSNKTARMASDASISVGEGVSKAIGNDGQAGGSDDARIIASSLANIGGGGGVFGTLQMETKKVVHNGKLMLEQLRIQNDILDDRLHMGKVTGGL